MKNSEFKIEDVAIREALPSDFEEISKVLFDSAMIHHKGEPSIFKKPKKHDPSIQEAFLTLIKDSETKYFVTAYENTIIGLVSVSLKERKNGPRIYPGRIATIGELVVKNDFRGQGIGKFLMDNVFMWVKTQGEIEEITLQVRSFNEGAINFYESLGFRPKLYVMSKGLKNE